MSVVIYGASDDLIEFEGSFREEIDAYLDGGKVEKLTFSNGVILGVSYGMTWSFEELYNPHDIAITILPAESEDGGRRDDEYSTSIYSDRVTMEDDSVTWVRFRGKKIKSM